MTRQELINFITNNFNQERLAMLDSDFLSFELDMATMDDLKLVADAILTRPPLLSNQHNSCILYATELSDTFDFNKARADTVGGSPPDKQRETLRELITEGQELSRIFRAATSSMRILTTEDLKRISKVPSASNGCRITL